MTGAERSGDPRFHPPALAYTKRFHQSESVHGAPSPQGRGQGEGERRVQTYRCGLDERFDRGNAFEHGADHPADGGGVFTEARRRFDFRFRRIAFVPGCERGLPIAEVF
jgi:hypothetical protein